MSERMRKIIELGEDLRENDIELGRRLERERIVAFVRNIDPDGFLSDGWCNNIAKEIEESN